jgi:SpoIVB peptidase
MHFLKKLKLQIIFPLLILFIMPTNIYAYSKYIIPGGETIGIEVNSKGVLVVGFYEVNSRYVGKDAGFEIGDTITEINNNKVNNINEMVNVVNEEAKDSNKLDVTITRNNKSSTLNLEMLCDSENVCKTGLYVKDEITGIGTLTYIDPKTTIFGALGHEITERTTGERFEIKDGKIFKATVTDNTKSENGSPGEKNATYDETITYGKINSNEESGIFGKYTDELLKDKALEVGTKDDVKKGEAIIRTVINGNEVKEYTINILNINKDSDIKNILFEITDKELLNETGGVIQGMSGSPIIQNDKIVGAVTHVIVNDAKKGYGIFITTMLEEGDKSAS